jgi:adenylate cyclase
LTQLFFTAGQRSIYLEVFNARIRWRAELMNQLGRPAEALPLIDRALAMDPTDVALPMLTACLSRLLLGQTEQAVSTCEKASALNDWWGPRIFLVAAYGDRGDMEKATVAKAELLRLVPGYTIAQARAADQHWDPEYAKLAEKYIYEGLRKAGIPEQ